jgi:polyisoprenoid-binding protein YceI
MNSKKGYSIGIFMIVVMLITACTSATATQAPAATIPPANTMQAPAATDTSASVAQSPMATDTPANTAAAGGATTAPAAGSLTFTLTPGQSTASYKVREQLASLSLPSDAIGKTTTVSGSVTINADGSIASSNSKFTVDLSTLVSDQSMRDGFIKRSTLNTSQYPNATFVPTQATGLPNPLPTSGQVSFKLTGDLTVKDVTKSVTWDVTGTINGAAATGTATTSFTFEYFNLTPPKVGMVLNVVDNIALEIDGAIQRSTN